MCKYGIILNLNALLHLLKHCMVQYLNGTCFRFGYTGTQDTLLCYCCPPALR